jgi:hypothetical protein
MIVFLFIFSKIKFNAVLNCIQRISLPLIYKKEFIFYWRDNYNEAIKGFFRKQKVDVNIIYQASEEFDFSDCHKELNTKLLFKILRQQRREKRYKLAFIMLKHL